MANFSKVIELNTTQLEGLLSEILEANHIISKRITFWDIEDRKMIKDICVRIDYINEKTIVKENKDEN